MSNTKNNILQKLKFDPNNYDLNLNLGMLQINEQNYSQSKIIFKKLITINKKRYEAYLNLSNIENINNNFKESEKVLKKFISKNGYNKEIISALSILYYNIRDFKKLQFTVKQYIDLEENHILNYLKAILLEDENQISNSIFFLEKSISTNNKFWPAYEKIFNLCERTNNLDKFHKLLLEAKNIFTNEVKIFYFKALHEQRSNNNELALKIIKEKNLEEKFAKKENSNDLINLYDLLSKINVKIGNYDSSLNFAIKRNKITLQKESNQKFDRNILLNIIKKYKDFYSINSKENFRKSNPGIHHDNLAFLVGFPRSGTTLIDSILRSHSKTFVLEEKPFLIKIRHKYFKKNSLEKILTISDKEVMELQSEYFDSFSYSKNKIIIDKFPLNLIEIGFIKKIFPNSKIILALRHPLDSILSCVLTSFKINEAMANYENLNKAAIFYDEVFDLFNIYKSALNFNYYSIKYENLVNKFDNEIKNLLSFLNLDYENSLKNFHITAKNRDKINTPRYNQVTKPIYKDSLERYKKFSQVKTIEPLINKWIKQLNY
jgi:hypothetical protein